MMGRIQVHPQQAIQEFAAFNLRLLHGSERLRRIKDRDVQIATTPKQEVFRQDKTVLYRYEPLVERTVPGEQAGQKRVRTGRSTGRSSQCPDAGPQRLCEGRPHHPTPLLQSARLAGGNRRLHRDPAAWEARGRLRQRQVPRYSRYRHREMAAGALHRFLFDADLMIQQ